MIDAIYISKTALNALNINSVADEHCFQWNLGDFSRIATFDSTASGCLTEIDRWFQNANERNLTPVLLLTSQEATRLLNDLPRDAKIDILPESKDPRFSEASEEMLEYLYTPETLMVRHWINWKRLGILPPEEAAKEHPTNIWEAYGKGLNKWFKINQQERHPMAAHSLIFSRQKPVALELSEVDLIARKPKDDPMEFSPINLPFARFRLLKNGKLKVILGPMDDQELDTPAADLVEYLNKESYTKKVREFISTLFAYNPFEIQPVWGGKNVSDEDALEVGEQGGIQARLGWRGESPNTTSIEITLEIEQEKITEYLPGFGKKDEDFILSVLANAQDGAKRNFVFNLVIPNNKKAVYFSGKEQSSDARAGEYYQEAGDLVIYLILPLSKSAMASVGNNMSPVQLAVTFESSSKSVTFPFG